VKNEQAAEILRASNKKLSAVLNELQGCQIDIIDARMRERYNITLAEALLEREAVEIAIAALEELPIRVELTIKLCG